MLWLLWSLLALVACVGYTLLVNAGPARCPSCKRLNVFRRTRTGRRREGRDEEGILLRSAAEYACRRCGAQYWIVWDDFDGCRATMFHDTDAES